MMLLALSESFIESQSLLDELGSGRETQFVGRFEDVCFRQKVGCAVAFSPQNSSDANIGLSSRPSIRLAAWRVVRSDHLKRLH
jgi:hypothetical protein